METMNLANLAANILIQKADLMQPLTIPLQVRSAIQIAETFQKEWEEWCKKNVDLAAKDKAVIMFQQVHDAYTNQGIIQSIKLLRSLSGLGLKEAKDQVESWAKEYNWPKPEQTW